LSQKHNLTPSLKTGDIVVEIDQHYFRPAEVDYLLADASKARNELGWEPKVNFKELVKIMVDAIWKLLA
jgi:GDPmannose 4,6-dehydratase